VEGFEQLTILCGRVSHFTGLLELAEKGKNRVRRKVGAVDANEGLTEDEVTARKAAADAQMAALIEAEEFKKVLPPPPLPFRTHGQPHNVD
jgi:hypothetical protein